MKSLLILFAIVAAHARIIKRSGEIIFRDEEENDDFESRAGVFEPRFGNSLDDSAVQLGLQSELDINLFQGDIKLSQYQENFLNQPAEEEENGNDLAGFRTGLLADRYRWKKNEQGKIVVPYKIREDAGFGKKKLFCCF